MKRSFESSTRPSNGRPRPRTQSCPGFEWGAGGGGGGRRMEYKMVSVLWVFNLSVHVLKYLRKVVTALLNLLGTVSGRQD